MRIESMKPPGQQQSAAVNKNQQGKAKGLGLGLRKEVLEPGIPPQKLTYGKPTGKADEVTMKRLREDSEKNVDALKKVIVELLARQGYSVKRLEDGFEVDEQARVEAAALIADDGPMGPEAMSNRIVDFAKALAGGDSSKIGMLRGAIEEGFRQAGEMLGGLPEVSKRTYDLVMSKLDAWERE